MSGPVAVGYIHGGTVRAEFCERMLTLSRRSGTPVSEFIAVWSGVNVSDGRNILCQRFLDESEAPWLFMVDTDIVFPPDILDRLVRAADPAVRPIMGALAHSHDYAQPGVPQPMAYDLVTDRSGQRGFVRYRPAPGENEPVSVSATAAACLLIHRDALRLMRGQPAAPWFRESVIGNALIGEDMTFCLRANDVGIPVYVHMGVRAGHMKTVMLGEVR